MRIGSHHERPAEPYLSVVVTARNDDHGGNPLYRTQLFVDGLIAQCDRFRIPAELVVVEWNPPPERPRLADVIDWPESDGWCRVRFIEVPPELHERLEYSDRLPLFQMIGKNVGIRRAHGRFVLATNVDILFSNSLMRMVAGRHLRAGRVYRVNRYDVPADIDRSWPVSRRLDHCARSIIRINMIGGTLDLRAHRFYWIYPEWRFAARILESPLGRWLRPSHRVQRLLDVPIRRLASRIPRSVAPALTPLIILPRAIRMIWRRLFAFGYWFVAGFAQPRQVPRRIARRARHLAQVLRVRRSIPLRRYPAAFARLATRALHVRLIRWREQELRDRARIRLHTNASGDFTLLAREDWQRVRGYAEFEMYSMHIDGLFLYQAHYHGISEDFLNHRVYHVEHGGGFRPDAKGDESLDAQLEKRALPQLSVETMFDWLVEMFESKQPKAFNDETWGLADAELPEREVPLRGSTGSAVHEVAATIGSGEGGTR